MDKQKITKAIIVAAGLNSRMYPFTKEVSKLFLPILNKPMAEIIIEELADAGIKEVVIISNHAYNIKKFFSKDKHINNLLKRLKQEKMIKKFRHIETLCKLDYIRQDRPMGWMHEVLHAKKYVKNSPFVVCFSDTFYKTNPSLTKQVIKLFEKTGKNIFSHGRYVFKPSVFEVLEKERYVLGEDSRTEKEVFDRLTKNKDLDWLTNIKGRCCDIGDPLSYLKTQTIFGLDEFGKEYKTFLKKLVK